MPRKRKKVRAKLASPTQPKASLFRQVVLRTFGWLALLLGVVIFRKPERRESVLSGTFEWWRLVLFLAIVLAISIAAAIIGVWLQRRKLKRSGKTR